MMNWTWQIGFLGTTLIAMNERSFCNSNRSSVNLDYSMQAVQTEKRPAHTTS